MPSDDARINRLDAEVEELRRRVEDLEWRVDDTVTGREFEKAKSDIAWKLVGLIIGVLALVGAAVGITIAALA